MNPDVQVVAQLVFVAGCAAAAGVALWAVVRVVLTRTRPKPPALGAGLASIGEERFARLEQAIDAIAIEVERVAEAQRFSARLLSERSGRDPQSPGRGESEPEAGARRKS